MSEEKNIAVVVEPKSELAQMFSSLVELAKDPAVDAEKMAALADLQLKMLSHKQQEEFNLAKITALFEMPEITQRGAIKMKNGGIQSRYAKFEDIHRAVLPILRKNNLVISFDIGNQNGMPTVTPILSHTNGFIEKGGAMALAVDTTGAKNATQGAASAASLGKRHTMKAMLNIIERGEDNDGLGSGTKYIEKESWQEILIGEARTASSNGTEVYGVFFKSKSNMERGFLVDSGEHMKLKAYAETFKE